MAYNKEYYEKHKEKMLEYNRKWRQENKEKFNQCCYKCRKENAKKRRENGEKFVWHYGKERERLINARINRRNQQRENKSIVDEEGQDN